MGKIIRTLCFAMASVIPLMVNAEPDTFSVIYEPIPQGVFLDGQVEAINQGTVAAQTSGKIVGVYVDVNDKVKRGDVLLEISAVQQTATLDAAQANLASAVARNSEAQSQLSRYRLLFPKGAISQELMDNAEANSRSATAAVNAAKAQVAQAKDALGYTTVKAPYDGIVTERFVELGESVAPGTALMSGYASDALRVETQIPQNYRQFVNRVEQFSLGLADGAKIWPVSMNLFNYANPSSHTFTLRLDLPKDTSHYVPGMWVKVYFEFSQHKARIVPKSAIVYRGELSAVYRLVNKNKVLNPVRIGQDYGDYVEVLSGLEVGDEVLTHALSFEEK